jgi:hypothetical protein
LLFVDLVVVPSIDLSNLRSAVALIGMLSDHGRLLPLGLPCSE